MHDPVQLGNAGQQRLYGKMAAKPEKAVIEVQDNLNLLLMRLIPFNFMGFHEITPVIAHIRACSCCSPGSRR